MTRVPAALAGLLLFVSACATTPPRRERPPRPPPTAPTAEVCAQKLPMTVRFFDVAQALAVLVELPGGETILVDLGESPTRPGCGLVCKEAHGRLLERLTAVLGERPITLVWVTHQHSDHLGGAQGVFQQLRAKVLVDNGLDGETKQVARLHESATNTGAVFRRVTPEKPHLPLTLEAPVVVTPVVPPAWPASCAKNKNECSIGLRIDYCQSSVLFTGDAEEDAEGSWEVQPATLLQVGHHGSDTSSTDEFLQKVQPKYAVISSGKRGEGMNASYCHPRVSTVERLNKWLPPPSTGTVYAFDATVSCKAATDANWRAVPASDRLFSTARDGEVTLVTTGDGTFVREPNPGSAPGP